jgi:hypothetical protein
MGQGFSNPVFPVLGTGFRSFFPSFFKDLLIVTTSWFYSLYSSYKVGIKETKTFVVASKLQQTYMLQDKLPISSRICYWRFFV